MKAIELLKDYRNIDFGCNVEELHNEIDEAIEELETLIHSIKLGNVGNIIDFLVIKLNNGKVIEVSGIKHIDTVFISGVKYNVMSIVDSETIVPHEVLLDDSNYSVLMEDILK